MQKQRAAARGLVAKLKWRQTNVSEATVCSNADVSILHVHVCSHGSRTNVLPVINVLVDTCMLIHKPTSQSSCVIMT